MSATKPRILVIDDEPPIRDLLAGYLTTQGYQTVLAGTVEEAKQVLDNVSISLATLDVDLGGADGLVLLEQIKEAHPQLPVLMLTGMGYDESLLQEALRKGASGYASKTLSLPQLLMEVRRILKITRDVPADNR